jgi:hypothetical protein
LGCRLHRTTLLVLNRQDAKSAKGICNITAKHAKIAKEVLKFGSSKVLKLGCRLYRTTLLVLNSQDAYAFLCLAG